MGPDKFYSTCQKYGLDIPQDLAERSVGAYRSTYRNVISMWYAQERAMKTAIGTKQPVKCGRATWEYKGNFLYCTLPSGRALAYHKARVEGDKIKYMATDSVTKHYGWVDTYGGKIVENIIQAIARDILAYAMVNAERKGYPIVLTVHDELVAEVPWTRANADMFLKIITDLPSWADGCPITAEGWIGDRYKK
jgi:DNA polymerase